MFHNRLEYCSVVPMYWLQHESAGVSACSAAGGTSARTPRTSISSQLSCNIENVVSFVLTAIFVAQVIIICTCCGREYVCQDQLAALQPHCLPVLPCHCPPGLWSSHSGFPEEENILHHIDRYTLK